MPTIYIGRKSPYVGKTLFEILCNLKNFGVGRMVIRNSLRRYPESTFFVVKKAEPLMDEKLMWGKCLAHSVFRGVPEANLVDISKLTWLPDFELVAREDEWKYTQGVERDFKPRLLPADMECPPLMQQILLRERRLKGEGGSQIRVPLLYVFHPDMHEAIYRPVQQGEQPTEYFALKSRLSPCVWDTIKSV